MDFYKNLPLVARIAIPGLLGLIIVFLVYSMMLKPPPPVEVIATQDVSVFNTAKQVLKAQGLDFDETQDKSMFMLHVPAGDDKAAAEALAASGIKTARTDLAKKITCPAPPGFTATKAANERSTNCETAKAVQGMLLAAGAIAANVQVSQEENGTLLGPEKSMNVVAQVFLSPAMEDNWNAEQAARAISRSVGTSIDRVSITDDQLQSLFDGTSASTTDEKSGSAMALGCPDIATATEVETKRAAVRSCYESNIGSKLTELLGGSDRFVLTVEPTIDSVARQRTSIKRTTGPTTESSSQTGSGQSVKDQSMPPNSTEETSTDPAGDITRLKISVILDKDSVTEDQRVAVVSLLSSQVEPKRGDPAPVVKLSQFSGGAGDEKSGDELKTIRENASTKESSTMGAGGGTSAAPETEMPAWTLPVMGVLVLGMLVAVFILWRRSAAMNAERARLEGSFRNEQRLFEDFAQQNPDHLAQDLNALFGAPSAPEPGYR